MVINVTHIVIDCVGSLIVLLIKLIFVNVTSLITAVHPVICNILNVTCRGIGTVTNHTKTLKGIILIWLSRSGIVRCIKF